MMKQLMLNAVMGMQKSSKLHWYPPYRPHFKQKWKYSSGGDICILPRWIKALIPCFHLNWIQAEPPNKIGSSVGRLLIFHHCWADFISNDWIRVVAIPVVFFSNVEDCHASFIHPTFILICILAVVAMSVQFLLKRTRNQKKCYSTDDCRLV